MKCHKCNAETTWSSMTDGRPLCEECSQTPRAAASLQESPIGDFLARDFRIDEETAGPILHHLANSVTGVMYGDDEARVKETRRLRHLILAIRESVKRHNAGKD